MHVNDIHLKLKFFQILNGILHVGLLEEFLFSSSNVYTMSRSIVSSFKPRGGQQSVLGLGTTRIANFVNYLKEL